MSRKIAVQHFCDHSESKENLDEQINRWIRRNKITDEDLVDIKFSCSCSVSMNESGDLERTWISEALLIYKE